MKKIEKIINLIIFIVSMYLLHWANKTTSHKNLLIMLLSMSAILYVLFRYTKK